MEYNSKRNMYLDFRECGPISIFICFPSASYIVLTCTAKGQMIPGGWAELDTADIGLGFNTGHRVVKVGRPQLHWKSNNANVNPLWTAWVSPGVIWKPHIACHWGEGFQTVVRLPEVPREWICWGSWAYKPRNNNRLSKIKPYCCGTIY